MQRRHLLASALAAPLLPAGVAAQEAFPSRPLQLVVPFPPGGAVDIVGRRIAERWREALGQPVVVTNRPGANGVVAWQSMLTSRPDGHDILAPAGQGLGFIHLMNARITTPFLGEFTPVAGYASYPVVFLVHKDLPVASLKELAAHAQRNPRALSYGTTGVGSGGHFLFELYKSTAGVPDEALQVVHYGGIAPELTALVGGQIQAAIMPLTSLAAQQIDAGAIRALAVSAGNRSPFRKEIPTVVEQGFPDLVAKDHLTFWVLSRTPAATVRRLAEVTRQATEDRDVRKILEDLYLEVEYLDGAGARRQFEQRAAAYEPLIKRLNIRLQ